MKFDIYGKFELLIQREGNQWIAYRTGNGLRRKEDNLAIPSSLSESEILTFLDDIYHEWATPDKTLRKIS